MYWFGLLLLVMPSAWAQGIERTAALPTTGGDTALWQSLQNSLQALRTEVSQLRSQQQDINALLGQVFKEISTTTLISNTMGGAVSGSTVSSSLLTSTSLVRELLPNCQTGQTVMMGPSRTLVCQDAPKRPCPAGYSEVGELGCIMQRIVGQRVQCPEAVKSCFQLTGGRGRLPDFNEAILARNNAKNYVESEVYEYLNTIDMTSMPGCGVLRPYSQADWSSGATHGRDMPGTHYTYGGWRFDYRCFIPH